MNFTSRMTQLLGAFRRERNGLVADTMHYEGARYGLNYGVSLPTVRRIVRGQERDHLFARFLYGQDVRCLQLAALHLADPVTLADPSEASFWLSGVRNSELAEEAAFALFGPSPALPQLVATQLSEANPLTLYLLLMATARSVTPCAEWIDAALSAVHRMEECREIRLLVHGLIALWAHLAETDEVLHKKVAEAVDTLGSKGWEQQLREEMAWRLADQ